jgi:hypothetical protein
MPGATRHDQARQRIADGRTHMRDVTASTRSLWPRVSIQITTVSAHQEIDSRTARRWLT